MQKLFLPLFLVTCFFSQLCQAGTTEYASFPIEHFDAVKVQKELQRAVDYFRDRNGDEFRDQVFYFLSFYKRVQEWKKIDQDNEIMLKLVGMHQIFLLSCLGAGSTLDWNEEDAIRILKDQGGSREEWDKFEFARIHMFR